MADIIGPQVYFICQRMGGYMSGFISLYLHYVFASLLSYVY